MKKVFKWIGLVVVGTFVAKKVVEYDEKKQNEFFESIVTNVKEKVEKELDDNDKVIGTYIEMTDYMLSEYDEPVIFGGVTTIKNDYQFIVCSQTGELVNLVKTERSM